MPVTSRREFLVTGGATIAALTALQSIMAHAFPRQEGEAVIPWLDQPPENPVPQVVANQLQWEQLNSWLTPNGQFFSIAHYDRPTIDPEKWKLGSADWSKNHRP